MPEGEKAALRKWMQDELAVYHRLYEGSAGELNATGLAEAAAWAFDHDEWLDDETHEVWEIAAAMEADPAWTGRPQ